MGYRFPTVFSNAGLGNPAGAAEAVLCTVPVINTIFDSSQVLIFASFSIIAAGATSTGFQARVRRGITALGVIVGGTSNIPIAAAAGVQWAGVYADTPGAISGLQYSLTVTMTGATGGTTIGEVSLMAIVL